MKMHKIKKLLINNWISPKMQSIFLRLLLWILYMSNKMVQINYYSIMTIKEAKGNLKQRARTDTNKTFLAVE